METITNQISQFIAAFEKVFEIVIGAIQDPAGAINSLITYIIDLISNVLPSTPDEYKIATLLQNGFSQGIEPIALFIITEIFQTAMGMLAIFLIIKIYQLIPFKAS